MSDIGDALLAMLKAVAEALGEELRDRLVFVGGCTTALFVTDPVTMEGVRATEDIDLIIDLTGYPAWTQLQEKLRAKGFQEAGDANVICRMKLGLLTVDFMPDDAAILGFTNRWYARGIETALAHELDEGLSIKVLRPEMFVATKLEAYLGRGQGDLLGSRDAEDILLVVDGREELVSEIAAADGEVRAYIAGQFRALMKDDSFENFIDGNTQGPSGRVDIIHDRFLAISQSDRVD